MFTGLAEQFTSRWPEVDSAGVVVLGANVSSQGEVGYVNWVSEVLLYVVVALVVCYLLYRFLLPLFWRIERPDDVYRLRAPWWIGVLITLVAAFLVTIIPLAAKFSGEGDNGKEFIGPYLLLGLEIGAVCVLIFWIGSLISSPKKCMYAPLLRRQILRPK